MKPTVRENDPPSGSATRSTAYDLSDTWDISASLCLIPARGGSVGVPGKNLRPLDGVPLVAHSIRSATASGLFDNVYVSTDDLQISEVAAAYGAISLERPAALARAETPMAPVVEHAVEWCKRNAGKQPRYIFLLQPTSPLRSAGDIQEAARLLSDRSCDSAMGVFEIDDPPQWGLRADSSGLLRPVDGWERYLARRQDLPPTYLDGPVYAIQTDSFLAEKRFLTDRTRSFVIPRARAVDIDTEFDFLLAEFLLERQRKLEEQTSSLSLPAARHTVLADRHILQPRKQTLIP
jgi:CMP-N,N'-diacetyllegionaminic acid synthase